MDHELRKRGTKQHGVDAPTDVVRNVPKPDGGLGRQRATGREQLQQSH
jgi:hypothetical protein